MNLIERALKAIKEDQEVYPTKPKLQSFLEWLGWYWDTQICLGYTIYLFCYWADIMFKSPEDWLTFFPEDYIRNFWGDLSSYRPNKEEDV
jgi:hypothetical protein